MGKKSLKRDFGWLQQQIYEADLRPGPECLPIERLREAGKTGGHGVLSEQEATHVYNCLYCAREIGIWRNIQEAFSRAEIEVKKRQGKTVRLGN